MQQNARPMQLELFYTRVFAAAPGGGNPCPVILGADTLTKDQMQYFAREFGLDTAFVLRPSDSGADLRIRYFVPDHEMGISVHASIAAVTVVVSQGLLRSGRVRLQTISGLFDVVSEMQHGGYPVTVQQRVPVFGASVEANVAAQVLGVAPQDIDPNRGPIQCVSVSREKLLVPLRSQTVLRRLTPDMDSLWRLCEALGVSGLYPFVRATEVPDAYAEARQFPLRAGFPEDAATGVAAAALGGYLTRYDYALADGRHEFRIAQGYAMGHPSKIDVCAESFGGQITRISVRGIAEIVHCERIEPPDLSH